MEKESEAWISYNVRPWYYYWKFFLESGVWAGLLITATVLPVWNRQLRHNKLYLLPLLWMLVALVLLSLLPEKKMRYIFPLLIPASMLMGELVDWWKKSFVCGAVKRTDSLIFRSNVWLVAIAVALLPVAGWIFMFSCGKMTLLLWFVVTCICLGVVLVLVWSGLRMRVSYMENKGTGILFYFLEQYPRPFVLTIFNPIKYPSSSTLRPLIFPNRKPQITPLKERKKVVKAITEAGNQMPVFRKAILTPTARASILVATPRVKSIRLEKVIRWLSSSLKDS